MAILMLYATVSVTAYFWSGRDKPLPLVVYKFYGQCFNNNKKTRPESTIYKMAFISYNL